MTNTPPVQHNQSLPPYDYEDEISLVDLWLVLVRHRLVILSIMVIFAVVGAGIAFGKTKTYQYSTTIEVDSLAAGHSLTMVEQSDMVLEKLVEQPDTVLAKIKEVYIPIVRRNYLARTPEASVPELSAKIPKGSQVIILESEGPAEKEAIHAELHNAIVDHLTDDHNPVINIISKEIEIQLQLARSMLAELRDDADLIIAKVERTSELTRLLSKQADLIRADLTRVVANRDKSVREVTDESRAMTLLMLDSDIQELHKRLADIEERHAIQVPETQDTLAKALADNKRAQDNQNNIIAKLEAQLSNLQKTTYAIGQPMRSLDPLDPKRGVIMALSLVLGLFVGVFAAFFAEFLSKVRIQSKQVS